MAEINDLNVSDGWNTGRFPENQAPSTLNNGARALEGMLARGFKDAVEPSLDSTGSSNAYVVAANRTISAYYDGMRIAFHANHANTGAATLNVDAVGAKTIKKNHDVDLASGDIEQHQVVEVVYSASDDTFQMVSQIANAAAFSVVDDTTPQLGGDLDLNGNAIDFPTTANIADVLDEDNMASDSATALATQQSIKAYVDNNASSITLGTEASLSGTSTSISTSIPTGTKRIDIMFEGVTLSGTDNFLIQIGGSGGLETSGYVSGSVKIGAGSSYSSSTSGFVIRGASSSAVIGGNMTLLLKDATNNTWTESHSVNGGSTDGIALTGGGVKSLLAELGRLSVLSSGSNTLSGSINIQYS